MASNSKSFSYFILCEYSKEDYDYQLVNNQPLIVNFASTFFFPSSTSIGLSIDEEDNHMDEMSIKSLWISYRIPCSNSLERARENKKPSHPPPKAVTTHPNFFTHGVTLHFHHYLRYMPSNFKCAPTQLSQLVWP